MTALEQTIVDERRITTPIPCQQHELTKLAGWLADGANQGYVLKEARTLMGGHQRDEYVKGLRLTLKKS